VPEIQRLQDQLTQYDLDGKETRARYTDTSNRLDALRATPVAGSVAQGEAQRLQDQLTQYQDKNRRLLDSRQSIILAQTQGASAVAVVDPAQVPKAPIAPLPVKNGILGGAIGLLLAAGLALLLDFRDDRVHDPEELTQRLNVPLLGVLGASRGAKPLLLTDTEMPNIASFREAIRAVRTTVDAALTASGAAICVTSAKPGEGKSTVAANLALIEAQAGKRVLLIDADVCEPRLHKLLGIRNNQGLSAYLARTQHGSEPKLQQGPHGITVLTAGWVLTHLPDLLGSQRMLEANDVEVRRIEKTHLPDLLGSQRMVDLIASLRTEFDIIILDTAPVLSVTDTLALQRAIDGTVLVMDANRTGTRTLERALAALQRVSGTTLGVVFTRDRKRAGTYGNRRSRMEESDDEDAAFTVAGDQGAEPRPVSLSA